MNITKHTPLADVAYFLDADKWKAIIEQVTDEVVAMQEWQPLQSYTLGEFIELSQALEKQDTAYIINKFFTPSPRKWWQFKKQNTPKVWDVAIRMRWLMSECERIAKYFEQLNIPQDADERQAEQNINFLNGYVAMLIFAQQKFFLHSIEEAEQVKLSEYLAMKKHEVDGIKYQRNLQKIYQQKHQQKQPKK